MAGLSGGDRADREAARSRRVLITGLSSPWGGRLAAMLERGPELETIIGIDTDDPRQELERTEFIRVGTDEGLLRRIIRAARIDTIVDTRLRPDGFGLSPRQAREVNLAGTASILAAAAGPASPVRKIVFRSSAEYYGGAREDPAFFTEEMAPTRPPRSAVERDIAAVEQALSRFADEHPDVTVTILRSAIEVGADLRSAHLALLSLPVVPAILGFDPRWQFVHEDDVVGVLAHAVSHHLPGPYNVAGDGVLALSEVVSLLGKPLMPVLPPWGTVFTGIQLRRLGLRVPVELLRDLRYGRGVDNRRLKASGYTLRYTSREAVLKLRAHHRLRPLLGRGDDMYRYEREVEDFLRWSPSIHGAPQQDRHDPATGASAPPGANAHAGPGAPLRAGAPPSADGLDDLTGHELVEIIPSLETEAMRHLRAHEAAGSARPEVLEAIDHQLALREAFGPG